MAKSTTVQRERTGQAAAADTSAQKIAVAAAEEIVAQARAAEAEGMSIGGSFELAIEYGGFVYNLAVEPPEAPDNTWHFSLTRKGTGEGSLEIIIFAFDYTDNMNWDAQLSLPAAIKMGDITIKELKFAIKRHVKPIPLKPASPPKPAELSAAAPAS